MTRPFARWPAVTAFAAVALAGATLRLDAQTATRAPADSAWRGWAYLAIGPGSANGQSRAAGDLGLWLTHDRLALAVRTATASRLLENGEMGDFALLGGVHPHSAPHADVVLGAGLGMNGGTGTTGERLDWRPAIAAGAQANFNYRYVGIGVDAFASFAEGRQLWGVGIALAAGVFR